MHFGEFFALSWSPILGWGTQDRASPHCGPWVFRSSLMDRDTLSGPQLLRHGVRSEIGPAWVGSVVSHHA